MSPPPCSTAGHRPALPAALVAAVLPAYLWPAVTTALNALVIPDPGVAARIGAAAWTTIAVPSAVAAGLVTLWTHHRPPPPAGTTARTVAVVVAACLVLAAVGTVVLIGHGVLPLSALQFTLTSAALGGGLSARRWARGHRRRETS